MFWVLPLFVVGCFYNDANWLKGTWSLPDRNTLVVVGSDSLIVTDSSKEASYNYSFNKKDSIILIDVLESKNAYKHVLQLKLISVSSNKDTIGFIGDYIEGHHMAIKVQK